MATDQNTRSRAQFLIMSILKETRDAIVHLHRTKPTIFGRGLARLVLKNESLTEIQVKLREAMSLVQAGNAIDWDALEQVGLTGITLESKADLFYEALGHEKPGEQAEAVFDARFYAERATLSYPPKKPTWSRLIKYLKSLLGSLINGVKTDSNLRLVLDFIKEHVECIEASLKFIQSGQETV